MAMGFMRMPYARFVPNSIALALWAVLHLTAAHAGTDVAVVGLFPGKAVLVINGGAPRTVSVGARTSEGVRLVSVDGEAATLDFDGGRHRIAIGERSVAAAGDTAAAPVTLNADGRGHFLTEGSINGAPVRFMVDTGATLVSLGAADAVRAGILYRKGEPAMTMTANGPAQVWKVKLDSVKVGGITLHDVDGAVHGGDLPLVLLGMSFLNRMEMKRDGDRMVLRRRF
jgi:aspartyl protease family protein